ncbi:MULTISPECIES: outer membrane lipoprotein-sorting protein [Ferrimonas]|uniref:outer membrane lipoprotein-sorting protein n=1 Tax=Ferrimonas TaxID=44011 RepID=UPI000A045605|nr:MULTISPECIES: outer membrane lipoprotein-sorting protein [Ferrimonas]USD38947.1 outer membrane lipoprotein-sorting protein [Ferrimonas sp. SCSIO 43195]
MYKLLCSLTHSLRWLAMLLPLAAMATPDRTPAEQLRIADGYRLDEQASKVVTTVSLFENDVLSKTRRYHVYTRANHQSLVLFKSKAEAGQKMLMLEDNYWLLMPKSRRPIRITPMQKLLGEASVGDLSTLTWSDSYQGQWVSAERITPPHGAAIDCNRLSLTARYPGASYRHIDLWLAKDSDFPVRADLYLHSGKLAKQAWFEPGTRAQKPAVIAMTLLDRIQPHKRTRVEYLQITPASLPDKYYNPAYLSRNSLSEL